MEATLWLMRILSLIVSWVFISHGWQKFMGGVSNWHWLGDQMQHFGIYFLPVAWGFAAACAEFFGGLSFLVGFATRVAAVFMACVMVVALRMHFANGDSWRIWWLPLFFLGVFLVWIVVGDDSFCVGRFIINRFID